MVVCVRGVWSWQSPYSSMQGCQVLHEQTHWESANHAQVQQTEARGHPASWRAAGISISAAFLCFAGKTRGSLCSLLASKIRFLSQNTFLSVPITVQCGLQTTNQTERPIRGSMCCRPDLTDASLLRGPLRGNWKTEALSYSHTMCPCVGVGGAGGGGERQRKTKRMCRIKKEGGQSGEIIDMRWSNWLEKRKIQKKIFGFFFFFFFLTAKTADLSAFLLILPHTGKSQVATELTQHKSISCN